MARVYRLLTKQCQFSDEMSSRPPEAEEHVRVRGTMISTFSSHPSTLSVRCVRDWGMPSKRGIVTVDNVVLNIAYDRTNPDLIHVWARKPENPRGNERYGDEESICTLS